MVWKDEAMEVAEKEKGSWVANWWMRVGQNGFIKPHIAVLKKGFKGFRESIGGKWGWSLATDGSLRR